MQILAAQDYISGLFVDRRLGTIPGTLPLSAIALEGTALTPMPAIVVNFRSFSPGCADPTTCGVEVADSGLQQGQGMHGSFSRADTRNIMGAIGPDFRTASTIRRRPATPTSARPSPPARPEDRGGHLVGRVLTEAMPNGARAAKAGCCGPSPDDTGRVTVLRIPDRRHNHYFDAAGYPGRTLGPAA